MWKHLVMHEKSRSWKKSCLHHCIEVMFSLKNVDRLYQALGCCLSGFNGLTLLFLRPVLVHQLAQCTQTCCCKMLLLNCLDRTAVTTVVCSQNSWRGGNWWISVGNCWERLICSCTFIVHCAKCVRLNFRWCYTYCRLSAWADVTDLSLSTPLTDSLLLNWFITVWVKFLAVSYVGLSAKCHLNT